MEALSDDVLRLILKRIDSHVSLIRAAAVCRRWRGAIADAAFLRRYRSLHAPSVAGDYQNYRWGSNAGPRFDPSSESMVDAGHFSLDFLPGRAGSWSIVDSRGSLLLLDQSRLMQGFPSYMVVCEPLTCRFETFPPPAEDMDGGHFYLIDGIAMEAGDRISMSNFRVLCFFERDYVMHTVVLNAGSLWAESNICHTLPSINFTTLLGPAGGKWYFCVNGSTLVELDRSTGDFTSSVFPAIGVSDIDMETGNIYVTQLRDGKLRIITFIDKTLKVFVRLNSGEWTYEKSVLLCGATSGLPGYVREFSYHPQDIVTMGIGFIILSPRYEKWSYAIDLETMEAKQAAADVGVRPMVYRCELPWPPALHAYID